MDDNSILGFGKTFNKTKLSDVPAWHLLWIYDNCPNAPEGLRDYIKRNMESLNEELEDSKNIKQRNYKARD